LRANRAWLLLVAMLLAAACVLAAAAPARAATITYTESKSNEGGAPTHPSCGGGTPTHSGTLLQTGATSGSDSVTLTAQSLAGSYYPTATGDPGLTTWASGNWVVKLNVTSANSAISWVATCILRINGAGTSVLATVGSLTGQNIALGSTGVQTMTISGASQSAGSGDRIEVELIFQNTNAHGGSQSANWDLGDSSNDTVATPLSSGIGATCPKTLSTLGVGC
jgi:hypothetical protein